MPQRSNSFTRDLDFLTQRRGYTVQTITAEAKKHDWTFTRAVMLIAEEERGGGAA